MDDGIPNLVRRDIRRRQFRPLTGECFSDYRGISKLGIRCGVRYRLRITDENMRTEYTM